MKKYFSKKLFLSIIVTLAILLMHKNVYAVGGQASGTSSLYSKTVSYFFELIRAMETPTGTLGKSSNINTTTYVDSSGNGIDCHYNIACSIRIWKCYINRYNKYGVRCFWSFPNE